MKSIDLCGTWSLRGGSGVRGAIGEWPGEQPFMPTRTAPVPGTVQEAMLDVTGEPTLAHNCYNARFIEEQMWNYSRTFELTAEDAKRCVRLVFDGLDLTANIYVNGRHAGSHNNYYTPCRLDVSALVREGTNTLTVLIESGLFYAADKPIDKTFVGAEAYPLTRRMWLRKPQSSFEWDWSPRLINVGIYKPCRIEISDGVFADETKLFARLSDDMTQGRIELTQYLSALRQGCEYSVSAEIAETGARAELNGITSAMGVIASPLTLDVPSPELWYPVGYGKPALYTVRITVTCGGEVCELIKKTGFRRVVIDQSAHPVEGKYFILNINGTNVFAKGGNMVPADILCSRFDRATYETLISRALEANFNALRVWGGGLYENDDFYELCDDRGVLVWQDFVNACASYPGFDREFFDNYSSEIVYNIRRLSCHPSLVIYSGNNEIDWMMQSMPQANRYPDAQLYYWRVPRLLKAEGEDRYYQPSSPYSDDYTDDNSEIVGDQHPWAIGFANRDYFAYRRMVCRFPNEGGILGPTSLPNMMACFGEGQDYIHSFDWQVHENSIGDWTAHNPDQMTVEKLGLKVADMSVRDYVYYGGFCQGEGLTEYILNFRRRMYSSASAIFWMYNDCWPATRSWTVVDYMRNRTPSFYPVKRAFAPVTVDIVREGDSFAVYAINERLHTVRAKLEYGDLTPSGEYRTEIADIEIPANSSVIAAEFVYSEGRIPYAILSADGEPVARRRYVDRPYNELGLERTKISCKIENGIAVYTSDKLVLGVCLDLCGEDGALGDNFFDLYPGKPYSVALGDCDGEILYYYDGDRR